MAKLIYELEGVRGRSLKLYDTKCVITTRLTLGSFFTGNFTDGTKTIYLRDIVGVQYKKSGFFIGFLQFETPSSQMNKIMSNFFSENVFTFEAGKNGVTNELMDKVYNYVTNRIEELKYNISINMESTNFTSETANNDQTPQKIKQQINIYAPIDKTVNEENSKKRKWLAWEEEQGEIIGQCEMCGKKKQHLLYVEFEDSFGTGRKELCFECFSRRNCHPIKNRY